MVKSMTGFGRGIAENENIKVTVDLRSVNHRYLEISVRMPREYIMEEEGIRKLLKENLKRGKVEVFVNVEVKECEENFVKLNLPLAMAYKNALQELKMQLDLKDDISVSYIIKYPDVIAASEMSDDTKKENTGCILEATSRAINAFLDMRAAEGEKLAEDIRIRLGLLREKVHDVKEESENIPKENKEKIKARVEEMLENKEISEERLLQEVAILADKANITEEVVRLESHIAQLEDILLNSNDSVGKKMDFLVQEMNREANTIASKANKLEVTRISLDMKCEIEKIREQVQNLE